MNKKGNAWAIVGVGVLVVAVLILAVIFGGKLLSIVGNYGGTDTWPMSVNNVSFEVTTPSNGYSDNGYSVASDLYRAEFTQMTQTYIGSTQEPNGLIVTFGLHSKKSTYKTYPESSSKVCLDTPLSDVLLVSYEIKYSYSAGTKYSAPTTAGLYGPFGPIDPCVFGGTYSCGNAGDFSVEIKKNDDGTYNYRETTGITGILQSSDKPCYEIKAFDTQPGESQYSYSFKIVQAAHVFVPGSESSGNTSGTSGSITPPPVVSVPSRFASFWGQVWDWIVKQFGKLTQLSIAGPSQIPQGQATSYTISLQPTDGHALKSDYSQGVFMQRWCDAALVKADQTVVAESGFEPCGDSWSKNFSVTIPAGSYQDYVVAAIMVETRQDYANGVWTTTYDQKVIGQESLSVTGKVLTPPGSTTIPSKFASFWGQIIDWIKAFFHL